MGTLTHLPVSAQQAAPAETDEPFSFSAESLAAMYDAAFNEGRRYERACLGVPGFSRALDEHTAAGCARLLPVP